MDIEKCHSLIRRFIKERPHQHFFHNYLGLVQRYMDKFSLHLHELTRQDIITIQNEWLKDLSPATRTRVIYLYKQFFTWLNRITWDDPNWDVYPLTTIHVPRVEHKRIYLTSIELRRIKNFCKTLQEKIIFQYLMEGFTEKQIKYLKPRDLNLAESWVYVETRKGRMKRPVSPELKSLLTTALTARSDKVYFISTPTMFQCYFKRVIKKAFYKYPKRRKEIRPKVFRDTWIRNILQQPVSRKQAEYIMTVSELAS